nr:glutathione S-transferase family protein [uncultured Pseudomonas sp.]
MQYEKLVLISHRLCPYVQRSVITLNEKQIDHERIYVNLAKKPDWFLAMSPLGKVPLLQVDDQQTLFESAVICEFLDEITPGSLHPADPLLKARHRAWIEFGSQLLNEIARLYNATHDAAFIDSAKLIRDKLQRLETVVSGPYFAGENFSLVDAAYGPIFRYFDTLDRYLPLDPFEGCPRVNAWRVQLSVRPSVRVAVSRDYPELLKEFVQQRDSILSHRIAMADSSVSSTEQKNAQQAL